MPPTKLALAHLPTPLFRHDALDALVGTRLWVKRDDMTAGPAAGNKIRKLEYLLADAVAHGATTLITCGGWQSNHARATSVLARRVGLRPVLLLRTRQAPPRSDAGNAFMDALLGAEIHPISPEQYAERDALMREAASKLEGAGERCYVIPEGGSNGLGALGYVDAMAELAEQLRNGEAEAPPRVDAIAHACGSGGTAAGIHLGAARHDLADTTLAFAVCDDRLYFERTIGRIEHEAGALLGEAPSGNRLRIEDRFKGPAYAVASETQRHFIVEVARACGLLLDPVYTGKALHGLAQLADKPERVVFVHTGGLPGLLAQAPELMPLL
ncbi:MAG: D-cysteine desulfhydrase family protein [Myxococcales bacterium]